MDKLIIVGRTGRYYIRFRAETKSMRIIKRIVEDLGSDHFVDNPVIPKTFSNYENWKDQWIPIFIPKEKLTINIICGDKIIHMLVIQCKNYNFLNSILEKYCDWAKPKRVKTK